MIIFNKLRKKNIQKLASLLLCGSLVMGIFTACDGEADPAETTADTALSTTTASEAPEDTTGLGIVSVHPYAGIEADYPEVMIDMTTVGSAKHRGLGVFTGGGTARLLMEYKDEWPSVYWEMMELIFSPEYGAGISHIRIELGSDVSSLAGTEAATMRESGAEADVTQSAGFMLAADARELNPGVTLDLAAFSEPAWVAQAFLDGEEAGWQARYEWYKKTLDAAYDEYGLELDFVTADKIEALNSDSGWIVYLSEALKSEADGRYDYGKIKIIAAEESEACRIADEMLHNEALLNAVDVLSLNSANITESALLLKNEYGKELWDSEIAMASDGDMATITDLFSSIIRQIASGDMNLIGLSPAISAFYGADEVGETGLVTAATPWNGEFSVNLALWAAMQASSFIGEGWVLVESASSPEGDVVYMTLVDPSTEDYTIVICNNTVSNAGYTFTMTDLLMCEELAYVWETARSDETSIDYYDNYLQLTDVFYPYENWRYFELDENDEGFIDYYEDENRRIPFTYSFSVDVKPFSIMTITSVDRQDMLPDPWSGVYYSTDEGEIFALPWLDDFENDEAPPKYVAQHSGAFAIRELDDGNRVLMQMLTKDMIPDNRRLSPDPEPHAMMGDGRWTNFTATIDFLFDSAGDETNYVELGVSGADEYVYRVYQNGKWEFYKSGSLGASGVFDEFDPLEWHTIEVGFIASEEEASLIFTAAVDPDRSNFYPYTLEELGVGNLTGRLYIGSGYCNNAFDELYIDHAE